MSSIVLILIYLFVIYSIATYLEEDDLSFKGKIKHDLIMLSTLISLTTGLIILIAVAFSVPTREIYRFLRNL